MEKIKLPNRETNKLFLVNEGAYWKLDGPELYKTYIRMIFDSDNTTVIAIDPPGGPFMQIGDVYEGKRITGFMGTSVLMEDVESN